MCWAPAGIESGATVRVLDRWRNDVDKRFIAAERVEHGEGASDGRGREHEFGGDAAFTLDDSGAPGWRSPERHGHEAAVTGSPRAAC